jgi:hypothetical protein
LVEVLIILMQTANQRLYGKNKRNSIRLFTNNPPQTRISIGFNIGGQYFWK